MIKTKIKVKVCELKSKYYRRLRDRALDKAKKYLFDDNQTMYKKYMRQASHYIDENVKVTKQAEELIYG